MYHEGRIGCLFAANEKPPARNGTVCIPVADFRRMYIGFTVLPFRDSTHMNTNTKARFACGDLRKHSRSVEVVFLCAVTHSRCFSLLTWPEALWPHVYTAPSSVSAIPCHAPAATYKTSHDKTSTRPPKTAVWITAGKYVVLLR